MYPALILIDIQKDYFPGGRMEVAGAIEASLRAKQLLEFFRRRNFPVVHVKHVATRPTATFLLPNTAGIDIHENVLPLPDEAVLTKHYPNSFRDTGLEEYLTRMSVTNLLLCGMMSHMCIDATARAAFDKGYACTVAHDACATRSLRFNGLEIPAQHVHASSMSALGAVYARVLAADDIIADMSAT